MKRNNIQAVLFLILFTTLTLTACGGDGGGGKAQSSLQDAKSAVIQIEAKGSFVDPEVGLLMNVAGRGSGFIIDPSGIAVTNNHVVTGAATLEVWVGGEGESHNAKVLGVSECSDLAVIDIEGEGYPYLEWVEGTINVGMDVYAAGFPLGDPEFTLTRGIVSKERADGETSWASVDNVLEHDATINPGNSGGPLVNPEGQVVGVNYAGSSGTSQFFAIARDEALKIIESLRAGQDVNSIGINGTAVNDGEGLSGIWVSSVKSGSPADGAGVKGGDILASLEGLVLATDYTMSDYCDILRTHNAGDTLNIGVVRFSTGEFLEGQLNGRTMVTAFSFGNQLGSTVENAPGTTSGEYSSYVTVVDDYGTVQVIIPAEWSDIDGSPWTWDEEMIGPMIAAAPDLNYFWDSWVGSGMYFAVSNHFDAIGGPVELLDQFRDGYLEECIDGGRDDFEDPIFTGRYDLFSECGGPSGPLLVVLTAVPKSDPNAYIVFLGVQITKDADLEALDNVLRSFQVIGVLP